MSHRLFPSPVVALATLLAGSLFLGACGSSPAVRYYTLQGPALEKTAEVPVTNAVDARSVQLVSLTVPQSVDRPQLVLRSGDNTLNVREQDRWAEPLKHNLALVLAATMMQDLSGAPVVVRATGLEESAWKLGVDIQRFEAQAGQAVTLEAVWTLKHQGEAKPLSRVSKVREVVNGDGLEAVVAAQSRAVAQLAREIARSVNAASPAKP